MVSKKLLKAADPLGFKHIEKLPLESSYLYGEKDGYLISLYEEGKGRNVFVNYCLNAGNEEQTSVLLMEMTEELKAILSGQVILNYAVKEEGLSFSLPAEWNECLALLSPVLDMLKEKGAEGVTRCSCCGNKIGKRAPKRVLKNMDNYLYCDHCALDAMESGRVSAKSDEAKVSVNAPGVIGALVGGLIGFFVFFALYQWLYPVLKANSFDFRYIFTVCGLLTAFLVYKGFTLFQKKASVAGAVIVSVFSVVFTAAGQYMGCFASYAAQQGFGLFEAMRIPSMWLIHLRSTMDASITYDQTILDKYNVSPQFYRLLLISLLFAVIGTILFQIGFFERSKTKKTMLEVVTYDRAVNASENANEPEASSASGEGDELKKDDLTPSVPEQDAADLNS